MSDWVKFSEELPPLGVPVYLWPTGNADQRAKYPLKVIDSEVHFMQPDANDAAQMVCGSISFDGHMDEAQWMYCGGQPGREALEEGKRRAARICNMEIEIIKVLLGSIPMRKLPPILAPQAEWDAYWKSNF